MKLQRIHLSIEAVKRLSLVPILLSVVCLPLGATGADLISPGRCIGQICLDSTKSAVRSKMGSPTSSEAISKRHEADVWISKRNSKPQYLFVIYERNKVVDVHVTSNSFKTKEGISTSSNFSEIRNSFPNGRENEYVVFSSGQNRVDWTVKDEGITFTFSGDTEGPVIRISIHRKGKHKATGYSEGDEWYWYPK